MTLDSIFSVAVLVLSVVVHEVSHGLAANSLGDPTARLAGRLTLNPLKHVDLFGSVILPLILVVTKAGFIFGWAKPVPYNPYNLRGGPAGEATVAFAGPASNLAIAFIFGLLMRFLGGVLPLSFGHIAGVVVVINLVLAVFNLVPIPPLDGSKILFAVLPYRFVGLRNFMERYGLIFLIVLIIFLWELLFPLVAILYEFFTGTRFS